MSPRRTVYCNVVRAVGADPTVREQIISDPSRLADYGFDSVPSRVKFTVAAGRTGLISYEADDGAAAVTIYMPTGDESHDRCCSSCAVDAAPSVLPPTPLNV